jgi:uncharacterized protein (DUF1501 family)
MSFYNRRRFLQASAAGFLGATGALTALGQHRAYANTGTGYKALIGIMLKGGTDMFDVVLPRDAESFSSLSALRSGIVNAHGGSRDPDNQIALNPVNASQFGTRQFGLAPELSGIGDMFANGECALVGSVGPLLETTNRSDMQAGRSALPANLFSHNDQQSTWMALGPEGQRQGWGGAMMDRVLRETAQAYPQFSTITAGSGDVFLASENTRIFKAPRDPEGLSVDMVSKQWLTSGSHGAAARERLDSYLRDAQLSSENIFARDVARSQANGLQSMRDYRDIFTQVGAVTTEFPDTRIGRQLAAIANSIHIRGAIGNTRQIFYADQGGFDTHDSQAGEIVGPLSQVFEAIVAFRAAMIETGAWDDVVLFTMSDFGRTLTENGDGTDHGWGSHQFVFGGSVVGNTIYGELPVLDPDAEHFTNSRARLIPSVAVEQYAATLGNWFGLDNGAIDAVLPNLNRFDQRDLGFLGAAAV